MEESAPAIAPDGPSKQRAELGELTPPDVFQHADGDERVEAACCRSIVVNGNGEDFAHRLIDRDDVSVYPAFRSIAVAGLLRAGADPPQPVRFVLDAHLRKLASLLRLCGFDAILLEDDADVANLSARDGRFVRTRDVGLLKRSIVRYGYWVRHIDPEAQLVEVLERFDVVDRMEPFTRCLRCNTRSPTISLSVWAMARSGPTPTRNRDEAARAVVHALPGGQHLIVGACAHESSGVPDHWAALTEEPGVNLLPTGVKRRRQPRRRGRRMGGRCAGRVAARPRGSV